MILLDNLILLVYFILTWYLLYPWMNIVRLSLNKRPYSSHFYFCIARHQLVNSTVAFCETAPIINVVSFKQFIDSNCRLLRNGNCGLPLYKMPRVDLISSHRWSWQHRNFSSPTPPIFVTSLISTIVLKHFLFLIKQLSFQYWRLIVLYTFFYAI